MSEMKNWVARAFLNQLLNAAEREDLRNLERRLRDHSDYFKRRSYLVGFEIVSRYHLKPPALTERQMMAMDKLFYKYQDEMERGHNTHHVDYDECECPTELDALYAWEDYAAEMMDRSPDWRSALTVAVVLIVVCAR